MLERVVHHTQGRLQRDKDISIATLTPQNSARDCRSMSSVTTCELSVASTMMPFDADADAMLDAVTDLSRCVNFVTLPPRIERVLIASSPDI